MVIHNNEPPPSVALPPNRSQSSTYEDDPDGDDDDEDPDESPETTPPEPEQVEEVEPPGGYSFYQKVKRGFYSWSVEFRMFIKYVIFLTLFLFVICLPRNSNPYYLVKGIEDKFSTEQIGSDEIGLDFTNMGKGAIDQWISETLFSGVYPETGRAFFIGGVNRKIGSLRIRTVKVRKDSCIVPKELDQIKECYGLAVDDKLLTDDYVTSSLNITYVDTNTNSWTSGKSKLEYSGRGHQWIVPEDRRERTLELEHLIEIGWFTSNDVRAIFVDLNMYNPNVDILAVTTFSLELLPSGGLFTTTQTRAQPILTPVRVLRNDNPSTFDRLVLWVEFCFYGMVVTYILDECRELRNMGRRRYFKDTWNKLEFVNLALFVLVIIMRIVSISLSNVIYEKLGEANQFVDLENVTYFAAQVDNLNSFNSILTFLKLFKFARENRAMSQLIDTLALAAGDMSSILVIIVSISCGYGIAFHLAFGHAVSEYRSLSESLFTLFLATLGDFDLDELRKQNQLLGSVLFISFIILMFFVILSMFLAIVDKSYETVRQELLDVPDAGQDPLTRDCIYVLDSPFRFMRFISYVFVGTPKDGEENANGGEAAGNVRLSPTNSFHLDETESVNSGLKANDPGEEYLFSASQMKARGDEAEEHKFKKLYDDAMGRIDVLKKTQDNLQITLDKIGESLGVRGG